MVKGKRVLVLISCITSGKTVERAMESVEYYAKVTMYTRLLGIERPLTEGQIDGLLALRPSWGIERGGRPKGRKD